MAVGARFKRGAFLLHRWMGVAMCVFMALWFVSGVVMLFVGYPKLTPWERLAALPALAASDCCMPAEVALAGSGAAADVREIVLTSIANRPHYVLRDGGGRLTAIDAAGGRPAAAVGPDDALESARAFLGGSRAKYLGTTQEDRWTHSRALNPHRPLHIVRMHDEAGTLLYVSSATGQVVLDAPRAERIWNFTGAWLHWLYALRNRPTDPVWTWTLIVVSGIGVIAALTGVLNGLWRWRFRTPYRNGTRSPFREAAMRRHHLLGLVFGTVLCTWIFSGFMSMNPTGIFDAAGPGPDKAAYEGALPAEARLALPVGDALSLLRHHGFQAVELEWRVLGGRPFILARDARARTRLLVQAGAGFAVLERWPEAELLQAAHRLLPARIASVAVLEDYDAYYFKRGTASMYGADQRRLPALRIVYDDPGQTWVHIDVHTGQVESSLDRRQRLGRWLFNFLHSWDAPSMLRSGWLRTATLVVLSAGGMALSLTSVVIAWRRVRRRLGQAHAAPLPERGRTWMPAVRKFLNPG